MPQQFDTQVISALEKWPNVPACYGWLSLSRRGRWLIQKQPISHARAIDFLGRNYGCDECGQWFVQNGPQRAYCALDYTPWIYHLDGLEQIFTHTENQVLEMRGVVVDDAGDILVETEYGIGLLEDRDLARFLQILEHQSNNRGTDNDIATRLSGLDVKSNDSLEILWHGEAIMVQKMYAADVPKAFGFVTTPSAALN